jgi:hypothetical protein
MMGQMLKYCQFSILLRTGASYIHHDCKGGNMGRHDEDQYQHLCNAKDHTTNASEQKISGRTHSMDSGIHQLELTDDIPVVCRKYTQKVDQKEPTMSSQLRGNTELRGSYSRQKSHFRNRPRQGEYAEGDCLGEHQKAHIPGALVRTAA